MHPLTQSALLRKLRIPTSPRGAQPARSESTRESVRLAETLLTIHVPVELRPLLRTIDNF